MKLLLLTVGKTDSGYLKPALEDYSKRLKHYLPFEQQELPGLKQAGKWSEAEQKEREGKQVLDALKPGDWVVLFDEKGKQHTSEELAQWFQKRMNQGVKRLVFVVGGPYGFSQAVYQKANEQVALSKLTFSHQMVRLFAVEQFYRAMTILRGEPYHHR